MASSSATTWRSPLSILMGARRNDDDDLELRDDYMFRGAAPPSSPPAPAAAATRASTSPPPPAAAAAAAASDPGEGAEGGRAKSYGGLASYLPLGYFGLTSEPSSDADRPRQTTGAGPHRSFGDASAAGRSPGPPRGAFPPPIAAESGEEGILRGESGEGIEDFVEDERQYSASHPWFHRRELTDPNDGGSDNSYGDRLELEGEGGGGGEGGEGYAFFEAPARGRKKRLSRKSRRAVAGATFNFANSIIGAGAMGLGGAFAASGGVVSILMILGFAALTKLSLDLVVDLSSCPSVIRLARRDEDRVRRRRSSDESFDGSSLSEEEEESSGSDEGDLEHERLLEEALASKKDDGGDGRPPEGEVLPERANGEGGAAPAADAKDVGNAPPTEPSPEEENNDPSPLMPDEDEKGETDQAGDAKPDAFRTPAKAADAAGPHHPLVPASPPKDRCEFHTMDVTEPRRFSPLHLNPKGEVPVIEEPPSLVASDDPPAEEPVRDAAQSPCTYEELGRAAYGASGRMAVLLSKAFYSFGCLVAYVVVVRDNFGPALRRMTIGPAASDDGAAASDGGGGWTYDDDFLAFWVSALFVLPMSCPREMKSLAKFSFVSVLSIAFLALAVIYLSFSCANPDGLGEGSFYENWIEIRSLSGFLESLGTFVFTFVCHHTVNLAYESLPPPIRNPRVWRRVSTNAIALAAQTSLAIGAFAYLTFGAETPADVVSSFSSRIVPAARIRFLFPVSRTDDAAPRTQLMGYPADLALANVARLLLCLTMVLTFPLPFLTCREMSVLICLDVHRFYHVHELDRIKRSVTWCKSGLSNVCKMIQNGKRNREVVAMQMGVDVDDAPEEAEFVHLRRRSFFRRWSRRRDVGSNVRPNEDEDLWNELEGNPMAQAVTQALLSEGEREGAIMTSIGGQRGKEIVPSPLSSRSGDPSSSETTISSVVVPTPSWILLDGRQLTLPWHAALTFMLWLIATVCAIKSPSLGDVLDLTGAFTGTLLAFVLPCVFSFKLKGYSHLSMTILAIGGIVGLLGTCFSFVKFVRDAT
ncbi:hypothetical protein ACHAWF_006839 [Thalassiosira exigua]